MRDDTPFVTLPPCLCTSSVKASLVLPPVLPLKYTLHPQRMSVSAFTPCSTNCLLRLSQYPASDCSCCLCSCFELSRSNLAIATAGGATSGFTGPSFGATLGAFFLRRPPPRPPGNVGPCMEPSMMPVGPNSTRSAHAPEIASKHRIFHTLTARLSDRNPHFGLHGAEAAVPSSPLTSRRWMYCKWENSARDPCV